MVLPSILFSHFLSDSIAVSCPVCRDTIAAFFRLLPRDLSRFFFSQRSLRFSVGPIIFSSPHLTSHYFHQLWYRQLHLPPPNTLEIQSCSRLLNTHFCKAYFQEQILFLRHIPLTDVPKIVITSLCIVSRNWTFLVSTFQQARKPFLPYIIADTDSLLPYKPHKIYTCRFCYLSSP